MTRQYSAEELVDSHKQAHLRTIRIIVDEKSNKPVAFDLRRMRTTVLNVRGLDLPHLRSWPRS